MVKLITSVFASLLLFYAPLETNNDFAPRVKFIKVSSLEEALEIASKKQKPLFVDFTAEWCAPCRRMDKVVFNHPAVAAYLNTHFVSVKMDLETPKGKDAAKRYSVKHLPTMLVLSPEGKIIKKKASNMGTSQFINFAHTAKDESFFVMNR